MTLILENISKKIQHQQVLKNVCFELNEGEIVGLVGRNGAGKTTLFRTIVGEMKADFGRIGLDDQDYVRTISVHDQLFYVDMPENWLAHYTPNKIKSILSLSYKDFYSDWYDERIKQFNLNSKKRVQTYSKGMRALFTIIVGFASRARYVLLDEPLDGLDVLIRDQVKQLIIDRVNKNNTTVLIASHNLIELDTLVDRILLLKDGSINMTFAIENNNNIKKYQVAYDNDEMLAFLRDNGTIIAHVGHIVTVVFSDFDESIGIKLAGSDFKFIEELPIGSEDIFRASFASEAHAWQKELEGE
ncbi:ATP-binding cassette domain-containing protein [Leuconostoc pseudomesenteroides]|uniref:ABC transporter ATP-binding protein n=1 Tax=Leuconostoc pseudomesenteroides TaxID=33968 RepID=A0ABT6HC95_LEUPS|nr:ABC transporter ATP-binding protein [Leuconostoc pseudomesenteroides]MDG9733702.1 ABC transporter ATP-binding protein [Leuconostoc pseudomesenteroides]NKZ36204.1 ABC transporter ATP-binding protein [Leuconostoc pseudomesenteroides]QQB27505.1 ABC transporter ATP-binding protein [Leuconostoc pseudomesenteroides]